MNYPQQILNSALNVIFPIKCIGCGYFSSENTKEYLCKSCLRSIPIKKDLECIGCSRKSPLGKTCFECQTLNSIDNLLVVSDYDNPLLKKALKTFKYRFVSDMSSSFIPLIKKYIHWLAKDKNFNILADNPVIVPIPLHQRRLNWRGFNQAEVLAKIFADSLYIDTRPDILSRPKLTKPQAEIENKELRLKNLENIFKISADVNLKDKTIIIIDDICTTGTTLNEAATILKNNGAKQVIGFVIARG